MPQRRKRGHTDHAKGRPRSLTMPARGVPSHRPRGLLIALTLHALLAAPVLGVSVLRQLSGNGNGFVQREPQLEITYLAAMPEAKPRLVIEGPTLEPTTPTAPFPPSPGILDVNTAKIAAKRDELFPFLVSRLGFLERLRDRRAQAARTGSAGPVLTTATTPLRLSARELDAIVDRSWSRRDRWPSLAPIVSLADAHDPDEGQLPALFRAYVERNLLQPYFPASTPDARFWVVLGLAADHADALRYISRYVDEHPHTRTTTELLFLLDQLVEASRDAFNLLTLTPIDSLETTRRLSPGNFDLAAHLRTGWDSWAGQHGIQSPDALDRRIRDLRMQILSAIVDTSPEGYGVSDARFLAGRALWSTGDREAACGWWHSMRADERDSYGEVKAAVSRAFRTDGSVDEAAVEDALKAEQARWLRGATQRLARFGFTPTTY